MATKSVCVPVTNLWEQSDSVQDVDAPMMAALPDPDAWTAALTHDERLALRGRVASQLLLGEPVEVVREEGELSLVIAPWQPSRRDSRGYPGWVRSAHLADPPESRPTDAVVSVDAAPVRDHPFRLSFGTILPVHEELAEAVVVELPAGGKAALNPADCVVREAGLNHPVASDQVVPSARRFQGLEYLWGGLSSYGLDCSGLVHLTFRALGRMVPRDAHDQADVAERLDRARARTGDLYFFARPGKSVHHVGLALPDEGSN